MWGDLLLLPVLNALIVPHVAIGAHLAVPFVLAAAISLWLHAGWHGNHATAVRDHMWPIRRHGRWFRDLSLAGWLHVAYVIAELGLITAWAFSPVPDAVGLLVALLLSVHVPIGLLQPGWFATGHRPVDATPLLICSLALLWAIVLIKMVFFPFVSSWPS
ncbi:MAG: hypothetical protein LC791_03260, partial [Acidobacteria bacterium]|nr:hypothetical protein [Acidobacteriota bacterium]